MAYPRQSSSVGTRMMNCLRLGRWPNGSAKSECWRGCKKKPKLCRRFALRIERYFAQVQSVIEACPVV